MKLPDKQKILSCLNAFDFKGLLITELGWDNCRISVPITVDDIHYNLEAVAEKKGFVVFILYSGHGGQIPDSKIRRKIELQLMKSVHEHLIIFADDSKTTQVWQWVKREPNKPLACRESRFHTGQSGEALIQKLQDIAFSFNEEDSLTIIDVTKKTRKAFDLETVTKRFYDRFKKEHKVFLDFIDGIIVKSDCEWYASLMLNRMMFIYFIQGKEFLDGDKHYLRNRLEMTRKRNGNGKFHEFYRYFLLRLFHEGLGQPESERKPELAELLGKVPYLNGGLFDVHSLEREYPEINIPDEAFEGIFKFFDEFNWRLDERPLRNEKEINPDVLGYIFEKYINQKEMGAYYTKEDITGYIGRNTILPYLFNAVEKECKDAFEPGGSVWGLLKEDPDRYIYEAVRKGVDIELPGDIAQGLDDVSRRTDWNKPASDEFALPTETWREHVGRRKRCVELRSKLKSGEITDINDLITYNLDIFRFTQDVIETCEDPGLIRAFWVVIAGRIPVKSNQEFRYGISILDPTCGSGAFLFAALNILEPLYEECLEQMRRFVSDLEPGSKKLQDFRDILAQIDDHPNERYFVLKSIIISNLYGVDIMPEAIEICKLRLFLKLVAQIDSVEHVEPLPDIDFNIRAGNTLVGFASYAETKKAIKSKFDFNNAMEQIEENAHLADRAFQRFREMQTRHGMTAKEVTRAKVELRNMLDSLHDELDRYLAGDYLNSDDKPEKFEQWRASHRPFHWFVEFYGILKNGGFDVIIGNPPYISYAKVKEAYFINEEIFDTVPCGNLYAFITERILILSKNKIGVILPLSSTNANGNSSLQNVLRKIPRLYISHYAVRPSKLFIGVDMNLTIILGDINVKDTLINTTSFMRWGSSYRESLFSSIQYVSHDVIVKESAFPKFGYETEVSIWKKLYSNQLKIKSIALENRGNKLSFHSFGRYWRKCIREKLSVNYQEFMISERFESFILCLLNSQLAYWYWIVTSDCYRFTKTDAFNLPIPPRADNPIYINLAKSLLESYELNSKLQEKKARNNKEIVEKQYFPSKSKEIIDEIDRVLAEHYGFTDEELDFIINYDIKYRMGKDALETEESTDEVDG